MTTKFTQSLLSTPLRVLYSFGLYRVLEAATIAALVFSPIGTANGSEETVWLGPMITLYLIAALGLLVAWRDEKLVKTLAVAGTCLDIVVITLTMHALPEVAAGLAMMLLFNVVAAAMLLSLRHGMTLALLASSAVAIEYAWTASNGIITRSLTELFIFVASYLGLSWMSYQMGQRARAGQALAEKRRVEVANLTEINELIIRRMRTGVVVVDQDNHITLANEAGALLLGDNTEATEAKGLDGVAPELVRRLDVWRDTGVGDDSPLRLFNDRPEIQPRFARVRPDSDLTLVFLDDTTVTTKRAETLTLATLGRFSAALAHEVRNPLTSINYATQLLQESDHLDDTDQRLLKIIHQQCVRTNNIVESVLSLARRERAEPVRLELGDMVKTFIEETQQTLSPENDRLSVSVPKDAIWAMGDPKHIHQILSSLVHNALKHGRNSDGYADITLRVFTDGNTSCVEVVDQGGGIPNDLHAKLFQPFFTTSDSGTGLGLYIAHELARVNQARLEYVNYNTIDGGIGMYQSVGLTPGACFRLVLLKPGAGLSG